MKFGLLLVNGEAVGIPPGKDNDPCGERTLPLYGALKQENITNELRQEMIYRNLCDGKR